MEGGRVITWNGSGKCMYTQQINNRIWKNNTKNKNLQWVKEVVLQYVSFNLFKKEDNQLKSGSSNKSWIVTLSQERTAYTTTITSKIHPKRSRQHVRRHQLAGLDLSHFILVNISSLHVCHRWVFLCTWRQWWWNVMDQRSVNLWWWKLVTVRAFIGAYEKLDRLSLCVLTWLWTMN